MTTHFEQFKEDIKPHPFLPDKCHDTFFIRQGYLSSIDRMIDYCDKKEDSTGSQEIIFGYNLSLNDTWAYLKEQRKLIEDYK